MKNRPYVNTILDFFKNELSTKGEASLVKLISYFDYTQRTIPSAEEINEALEINKNILLKREEKAIYFVKADLNEEMLCKVTDDELRQAYKQYNKEFWKLHKLLQK